MRYLSLLAVFTAFLMINGAPAHAQTRAQEKAASLRAQLAEVEAKQAELQTRLQNLDEKLKPKILRILWLGWAVRIRRIYASNAADSWKLNETECVRNWIC